MTLKQGSGDIKNVPTNPLFNDVCGFKGDNRLFLGGKNTNYCDAHYHWKHLGVQIYAMISRINDQDRRETK